MKSFFTLIVFSLSVQAFAAGKVVEFDHSQEVKCHQEIKALGCASESDVELMECVETKKAKLSKSCQEIHAVKVQNSSI